jgi:hypothetical protein
MNKGLLIAIMTGLVSTVAAQTSGSGPGECKLTLAQAPAIRGIRLGMTVDQVLAQVPGSEADSNLLAGLSRDYFGSRNVTVAPGNYATAKEKFAGINSINLSFLDGRLLSFHVRYNGPEWRSKEQFVARVAEALNLPGVGAWKASNNALAVGCDGFEVSVQTFGGPESEIGLKDTTVDFAKIVQDRVEVPKEKARRAFKP